MSRFSVSPVCLVSFLFCSLISFEIGLGQSPPTDERAELIRANYTKTEVRIAMRDGVELFTSIYEPNDTDASRQYPILIMRTPYSVGPYGLAQYRTRLGPTVDFEKNRYIFVFQDVRGRYMSGGEFLDMRPHIENKSAKNQFDESSDTYDTIGAIDSHPALLAVSPQAPIADWFFDDFHRNGAFVLPMGFNFFYSFGRPRPGPTTEGNPSFPYATRDGYQFFLDIGPLSNVDKYHFHDEIGFWNDMEAHPNYDSFWQARNLLPHLKNIKAAVLTVGGWYDTEDLYGPLKTYAAIEKQNPRIKNHLVMGPWSHGQWSNDEGRKLGQADFGFATATWYNQNVLLPFFESHLRGKPGTTEPAEATVFETGANRWRQFDSWPPKEVKPTNWYFSDNGHFDTNVPTAAEASDSFISDPNKPVPYTTEITTAWAKEYVTEDQRFASWRPDVLVYQSDVLKEPLTIAGPIQASLWVTTDQGDADWVVKVIDVSSGTSSVAMPNKATPVSSGRQELVRAAVIRGRFRESFATPKPFEPGKPTQVEFEVSDILHTFQPGHRLMIQIQSTWFPFIDRNPQRYVPNIFEAKEEDFVKATHTVLRSKQYPSTLKLPILAK
jgi:uncharacterized protein